MHKLSLKIFGFIKNFIDFLKILIVFSFLMLLLYWINNLAGYNWKFLNFIVPLLDFYLDLGERIFNGTTQLFAATFEHKYAGAIVVIGLIYLFVQILYWITDFAQNVYEEGRKFIHKIEEDSLNKSLAKVQLKEQNTIKFFQIFVSVRAKSKLLLRGQNIDLEEQKQILYKYLIEKTGVSPDSFEEGVVFTFKIDDIDNILDIFSKLPESNAPVDYLICIQVQNENKAVSLDKIKILSNLEIYNKVIMLTETLYRYNFNKNCRYESSQLGIYQKNNKNFEVHYFVKKENI